jgi:hypothetical protein
VSTATFGHRRDDLGGGELIGPACPDSVISPGRSFGRPPARPAGRWPTAADDLPDWLHKADLDERAAELTQTGAAGALNRYRNIDRDWEDLAAWEGHARHQPSLFIAGSADASVQ